MADCRVSLCMIVRDEEKQIGNCLQSLQEQIDEMIIVDTGSQDRTAEICRTFGATVYDMTWEHHFAAARNYGLEKATGDWILWVDADEVAEFPANFSLRKALEQESGVVAQVQLLNYYGESRDATRCFRIPHLRLFRNGRGLRFKNRIHEALNVEEILPNLSTASLHTLPVLLHHDGYLDAVVRAKAKGQRNTELLQLMKANQEADPWVYYHLASEQYRNAEYEQAFHLVNHAIRAFLQDQILPPALLYNLKYFALLGTGQVTGAWPGIEKAIELYPDYVNLHWIKGEVLLRLGKYREALQAFETCLALGEDHASHLVWVGAGSFLATQGIQACRTALGHRDSTS